MPSDLMPAIDTAELRSVAERVARLGGGVLQRWRGKFEAREKAPSDLVTDADLASQQAIQRELQSRRPGDLFVGEELPGQPQRPDDSKALCWVVDPLDGTVNYVHGFPFYSTSVAVVRGDRVLAGAIYDPVRDELFSASEAGGATLNGLPLRASGAEDLGESLLAVSLPAAVDSGSRDLADLVRVAPRCRAVRRLGSAALNLAYVAAGRLDGHWAHSIYPWDAAAGVLIAQESGATVTGSEGQPHNVWSAHYLVAATPDLHTSLLRVLGS